MKTATDQETRPTFYDGQYLGADDMEAAVLYARAGQARHAIGAHLWGIGLGLELAERVLTGDDVEMVLTPGVAWDGYGRTLVAPVPQILSLDLFANLQDDTAADGIPIEIWLAYRELPASPPGIGFACADDNLYGRIVETYRVEVRRIPVTDYHSVTIANRPLAAHDALKAFDASKGPLYDESVPQQTFPENGDRSRWPVFVGIVRWRKDTGQPGRLIKRTDDDRNNVRKNRRYIGAVAETIVAPDGVIRLRDRSKDPDDPVLNYRSPIVAAPAGTAITNDLVWCEGNLRVVGDARLQDGKLDFRVAKGGDNGVPMYLQRTSVSTPIPKTTLEAFVGPVALPGPANAETRFIVSSLNKECLTVVTDGRVGIFAADPTNTLHVEGPTGIRYGYSYVTGDSGAAWTGFAFNAYAKTGTGWVLADTTHKAAAMVLDDTGGAPEVKFQTSTNISPPAWTVHLVVKGDTGNVGIGPLAPAAKLHVSDPTHGEIKLFSATADFEYDGGNDNLFVFRDTGGTTAFMGTKIGIGTPQPRSPLAVRATGPGEESISFEAPNGVTKWHINQNLAGSGPGLNFVETGVRDGRLFLAAGGNTGIGTTTPRRALHVTGDRIRLGDDNKRIDLRTDGSAVDLHSETHDLFIRTVGDAVHPGKRNIIMNPDNVNEGNVGIGTTSPQAKLHIQGDMMLNGDQFVTLGAVWTTSDRSQKHQIEGIERPLERLLALRGVSFAWREPAARMMSPERQLGFIAQDVETEFPAWVRQSPSGTKAVNLDGLNALVVEGMRELAARCKQLEAQVAELRGRLSKHPEDVASDTPERTEAITPETHQPQDAGKRPREDKKRKRE